MSLRFVKAIDEEYTAQAYITTDLDANQITAFHPGAMNQSWRLEVPADGGITIGVLAPDGREGMIAHAEQFARATIPFIFDPGQAMTLFGGPELGKFVEQATWIAVNDYEAQLLQERTGLSTGELAARVEAYIVTQGAQGSVIYAGGRRVEIPAVRAAAVLDPTGCGDAYRAGLVYGLARGIDWETTGRIASLMGAIKIATAGTQHHRFTLEEFRERFNETFDYRLE
jgi:adenosine kinase